MARSSQVGLPAEWTAFDDPRDRATGEFIIESFFGWVEILQSPPLMQGDGWCWGVSSHLSQEGSRDHRNPRLLPTWHGLSFGEWGDQVDSLPGQPPHQGWWAFKLVGSGWPFLWDRSWHANKTWTKAARHSIRWNKKNTRIHIHPQKPRNAWHPRGFVEWTTPLRTRSSMDVPLADRWTCPPRGWGGGTSSARSSVPWS